MEIAHRELEDAEADSGHQARRPDLHHAAPPALRRHQPERHDQGKQGQLAPDHRAEQLQVQVGDAREGHQGRAQRAKGNGGGIADQGKAGGVQRTEPEADHQCAGDRHRRAKTRRALDERAESEGDEQRLDPPVA